MPRTHQGLLPLPHYVHSDQRMLGSAVNPKFSSAASADPVAWTRLMRPLSPFDPASRRPPSQPGRRQ